MRERRESTRIAMANGSRCMRVYEDDSGSALVEFALSSVVLIMALFGIINCCFALYSNSYVSDAARTAARYAVVRGSNCTGMPDCGITSAQLQTYLRSSAYPGIKSANLSATTTWLSASSALPTTWTACANQCNSPGNAVQVQVNYAFTLGIPFWQSKAINLSSTSQMVISN
jgi:Flp pilus assembly protein TadG